MEAKYWLRPEVQVAYHDGCSARVLRELMEIVNRKGSGMNSSVRAVQVKFDADSMWVDLSGGRTIGVPLAWFPRLLRSTPDERAKVTITGRGLHWEGLDEDISIAGLLAGQGDMTTGDKSFAA